MPGDVLVTVGSTKFDQLIRAVDTQAFVAALHERGYNSLLVQVHAAHFPSGMLTIYFTLHKQSSLPQDEVLAQSSNHKTFCIWIC